VFATAELLTRPDIRVDILDRLPTPFGLVRYGVAPDHLKIKSVMSTLSTVLSDPRVRFHGNVEYGADVTLADLRAVGDAVVFATGAPMANRLGIPGEDLPGSYAAADLVPWYNGHPVDGRPWAGSAPEVAVIGGGNVALDVARVLLKGGAGLGATDIPDAVARALDAHPVTDVHLVIRRGVADVKFTPVELLEFERLDLDILVDPADTVLTDSEREHARTQRVVRQRVAVFSRWAERPRRGAPRRLHVHFRRSPIEIVGVERVRGIRLRVDDPGLESQLLPVGAVIAAVGYRSGPLPGVALDPSAGTAAHVSGRVKPGVYVAGWLKRGPSGVIGSNKQCAVDSVRALFADLDAGALRPAAEPGGLANLFCARGRAVVGWAGWQRIDEAERALGTGAGRTRTKITERARLVRIGTGPGPDSEGGQSR
jgi:ferredoxin--NADP+ reductase